MNTTGLQLRSLPPNLQYLQEVTVTSGRHQGEKGKVHATKHEGNSLRIELRTDGGTIVFVDQDEIDFKFETVDAVLMMSEDEREEFLEKINYILSQGYSA